MSVRLPPPSTCAAAADSMQQTQDRNDHRHWVQPSDTLQGLCLRYGISATQLRRANRFSGSNLALAPNPLTIPCGQKQSQKSEQDKIRALQAVVPNLAPTEAKSYLALNDGNLADAKAQAQSDFHERVYSVDPWGEKARFDTPIENVVWD